MAPDRDVLIQLLYALGPQGVESLIITLFEGGGVSVNEEPSRREAQVAGNTNTGRLAQRHNRANISTLLWQHAHARVATLGD